MGAMLIFSKKLKNMMVYFMKRIIILLAVMSALFLVGCQTKNSTGSAVSSVECTKQEAYTARVPYNETEFYYVKEGTGRPFCQEEPYTDFTIKVVPLGKVCQIFVTNTGNITGDWVFKAKFITTNSGGGPESEPQTKEIKPGETAKFEFTYTQSDIPSTCQNACTNVASDGCKTPSIEVCKYTFTQDVRKSRVITKFRNETRYRTVSCD